MTYNTATATATAPVPAPAATTKPAMSHRTSVLVEDVDEDYPDGDYYTSGHAPAPPSTSSKSRSTSIFVDDVPVRPAPRAASASASAVSPELKQVILYIIYIPI
jgi:hypothetical protein